MAYSLNLLVMGWEWKEKISIRVTIITETTIASSRRLTVSPCKDPKTRQDPQHSHSTAARAIEYCHLECIRKTNGRLNAWPARTNDVEQHMISGKWVKSENAEKQLQLICSQFTRMAFGSDKNGKLQTHAGNTHQL